MPDRRHRASPEWIAPDGAEGGTPRRGTLLPVRRPPRAPVRPKVADLDGALARFTALLDLDALLAEEASSGWREARRLPPRQCTGATDGVRQQAKPWGSPAADHLHDGGGGARSSWAGDGTVEIKKTGAESPRRGSG